MIIDIHAHTSKHQLWGLHTDDADIPALKRYAEEFGISKIILMATYFPFKKTGLANLELLKRIEGDPLFGAFGSLDLSQDSLNWRAGLEELQDLARRQLICGFKIYPGYQDLRWDGYPILALAVMAEDYHLPIACHLGELHPCCKIDEQNASGQSRCGLYPCPLDGLADLSHPRHLVGLAKKFPKVNFIACHLANPYFDDLHQAMAECPNIHTDISGQFVSGDFEDTPKYRNKIIEELRWFLTLENGLERLMFATDFPIQSYADSIDLVIRLGLSPAEEEMIFSGNAQRLLRL